MENKNRVSPIPDLPCESAPIFEKLTVDQWDKVFAVLYLFMGYSLFADLFAPGEFFYTRMAGFTVLYVIIVSVYGMLKKLPLTKEKIFWMLIVLAIGVPYGFYSIMPLMQLFMLFVTASYWTLVVTDGLLYENKTSSWVILDICHGLITLPVLNFFCLIRVIFQIFKKKSEHKEGKMILLGIVTALPVLGIILPVLSSADAGFQHIMEVIFSAFVFDEGHIMAVIFKWIMAFLMGSLMFGTVYGGLYRKHIDSSICDEWEAESGEGFHMVGDTAITTFSVIICLTYVLFIGLQGRYLFSAFLGILPESFTYAEYARKGFFELCGIAALNGGLILGINSCSRTIRKENATLRILNIVFSVLTILLLVTAMSKMGMYIVVYGFTIKRILTSVFMIWLFLVFSMVIILQKKEIPLVRWAVFSGAVLFVSLCILPIGEFLYK